jgi:hypothetical protein
MACHSCGGFEHFTQQDSMNPLVGKTETKNSCPTKETMSKCMYSAQGVFVCSVDAENNSKGVANNLDMMMESVRDKRTFNSAAPWSKQ